jgi:dethiobiotin synthetase
MAKGFFVTGTDTGVGKTVITVALLRLMGLLGLSACGMKPIETGCHREHGTLVPADGLFIKTEGQLDEDLRHISPCRFENPLAPLAASSIEGVPVDFRGIRDAYGHISSRYDIAVVEGVGGLLVPVSPGHSVIDLAGEFGLPLIVVTRPGLGTLNHTLLTVNYALREGLAVAGIIINYSLPPEHTVAEHTNADIISQLSPAPLLGVFPYLDDLKGDRIREAAAEHIDRNMLSRYVRETGSPDTG